MNKGFLFIIMGVGIIFLAPSVIAYKGRLKNNTKDYKITAVLGNAVWKFIETTIEKKKMYTLEPGQSIDYDTGSRWLVALDKVSVHNLKFDSTSSVDVGMQYRAGGQWTFDQDDKGLVRVTYSSKVD